MPYTTSTSIHDVTKIEVSKRLVKRGKLFEDLGPYWVYKLIIHQGNQHHELNLFSNTQIPIVEKEEP